MTTVVFDKDEVLYKGDSEDGPNSPFLRELTIYDGVTLRDILKQIPSNYAEAIKTIFGGRLVSLLDNINEKIESRSEINGRAEIAWVMEMNGSKLSGQCTPYIRIVEKDGDVFYPEDFQTPYYLDMPFSIGGVNITSWEDSHDEFVFDGKTIVNHTVGYHFEHYDDVECTLMAVLTALAS